MSLISNYTAELELIKEQLSKEKPGIASHMKVASVDPDRFSQYYMPSADAHDAAVLLLIVPRDDSWRVIFIMRASHKDDRHSGQISFPGGRKETTDPSLLDCALRETEEEIGIKKEQITILGELSPLYVFASNHMVYSYVGVIEDSTKFTPNEEVAELLIGDVDDIIAQGILSTTVTTHGTTLKNVPYYNLQGHVLWGATAMIFTEFLDVLDKIKAS